MKINIVGSKIQLSPSDTVHLGINNVWAPLHDAPSLFRKAVWMALEGSTDGTLSENTLAIYRRKCAFSTIAELVPFACVDVDTIPLDPSIYAYTTMHEGVVD